MGPPLNPPTDEATRHSQIPEIGDADGINALFSRHFDFYSVYRSRHLERMARNIHYKMGRQWIEPDTRILVNGVRGFALRDIPSDEGDIDLPRPMTNIIGPAVEMELALAGKRELRPVIMPSSRDPRIIASADISKRILLDRLKKTRWDDEKDKADHNVVVCGTGILKSWWDTPATRIIRIAVPSAVMCPNCNMVMSEPRIPETEMDSVHMSLKETAMMRPTLPELLPDGYPQMFDVSHCPRCGSEHPLQSYDPLEHEVESGQDPWGRPLGENVAYGNTAIESVSPFDYFPENGGVNVDPANCSVFGQATVRPLEWIVARFPEHEREFYPEGLEDLLRNHPILGNWEYLGWFDHAWDSAAFRDHARVYEIHAAPSYYHPKGRSIVVINNIVVLDDTLMIEAPDKNGRTRSVPRVKYSAARFKERPGEFWGEALVDILISPQNRINCIHQQIAEARMRMGSPNLLVPDDVDLSGPEWREGLGAAKIMRYSWSGISPKDSKPDVLGSILMPDGVYNELRELKDDIKILAGPAEVQYGEAPGSVTTTSGLQILSENAAQRRAIRDRQLSRMYTEIWEHQLEMIFALRVEPDSYESFGPDNSWEVQQFDRDTLNGQTKVKVEQQGYVSESLYLKEATREAQADGLIFPNNQSSIKRILELRGLPTDVNDDLNRQVAVAQRSWIAFLEEGRVPVFDESLYDPTIHHNVLSTELLSDEGQVVAEQSQWERIASVIAGWEEKLALVDQQEQLLIEFYGTRLYGAQAEEAYAKAQVEYDEVKTAHEKMQAEMQQQGDSMGGPPPEVPEPRKPPEPIFPPVLLQERIFRVWMSMFKEQSIEPPPEPTLPYVRFRAMVAAAKVLATRQTQALPGGGQTMLPGDQGGQLTPAPQQQGAQ